MWPRWINKAERYVNTFNTYRNGNKVTEEWRKPLITSIVKKGRVDICNNYG